MLDADLLQVSFVILFGPSRSAVTCESGASKASGTGSERVPLGPHSRDRVGPNKITDEPWGKSILMKRTIHYCFIFILLLTSIDKTYRDFPIRLIIIKLVF